MNSIQTAPVALAKTISIVAIAKGAAASSSTLTLVKGALKIMAWTKTKTAIVTGAVIFIVVLSWFAPYVRRAASAPKVAATFLSYTNGAGRRFVVISFVNHESMPIRWHDVWVQQGDSAQRHAPVINPSLPWITKPLLESGESEILAVGTPTEQVKWRVCWDYSPDGSTNSYTTTSRWFKP